MTLIKSGIIVVEDIAHLAFPPLSCVVGGMIQRCASAVPRRDPTALRDWALVCTVSERNRHGLGGEP
jgi:hypothetical protein